MKAYVELVQRRERDLGTDMLTHQKVRDHLVPKHGMLTSRCIVTVEWCRLCRLVVEDRHGRCIVDSSDGEGCHRVAVLQDQVVIVVWTLPIVQFVAEHLIFYRTRKNGISSIFYYHRDEFGVNATTTDLAEKGKLRLLNLAGAWDGESRTET